MRQLGFGTGGWGRRAAKCPSKPVQTLSNPRGALCAVDLFPEGWDHSVSMPLVQPKVTSRREINNPGVPAYLDKAVVQLRGAYDLPTAEAGDCLKRYRLGTPQTGTTPSVGLGTTGGSKRQ